MPTLNTPAASHQLQQCFWDGAQAGEEQLGGTEGPAVPGAFGENLHDPSGANPGVADVLRGLFRPQSPGDGAAMAELMIRCHEGNPALSLEDKVTDSSAVYDAADVVFGMGSSAL
jgi:hypothetical protein